MRVKFLAKVNNKAFDGAEPTTDQKQSDMLPTMPLSLKFFYFYLTLSLF